MHLEQRFYWTNGIIGTTGTTGIAETTGQPELRDNRKSRTTGIFWQEGPLQLHPAPICDAHRIAAWILNKFWICGLPIRKMIRCVTSFLLFMLSNVWIYFFRRFFIYQVCISKTANGFEGYYVLSDDCGRSEWKTFTRRQGLKYRPKLKGLVARCHFLLSL